MYGSLFQPEIRELIEKKNFTLLREVFSEWTAADLAELISELPEDQQAILFRILPRALSTETFEYLDLEAQKNLLRAMGQKEIAAILNDMNPDDRTALLEELPSNAVIKILTILSPEEREVAQSLLGYPEDSIGRLMTTDYIAVRNNMTVRQALSLIRKQGMDSETLNMVYVVDRWGKLEDEIRIRQLLLASPNRKIKGIMDGRFVSLLVTDDQESAITVFKKYDYYALPVVDREGHLLGIVTIDDMLDIAEEEATQDIQKIGGMEALDEPYLNTPLFSMVRKRAMWLVILFIGEIFTASAMALYENEIARAVVLALFVPLIISSGGNSGSQATTLIIRGLAVGEFGLMDWWRIMKREVISGLMLGLILAVLGFIRITLWQMLGGIYGAQWFFIALTVGISLVGVVMLGTIAGSMLPFVLKRIGIDPATSSAPFVATVVDLSGLIIYFNVAFFLLRGRLL